MRKASVWGVSYHDFSYLCQDIDDVVCGIENACERSENAERTRHLRRAAAAREARLHVERSKRV
jgi:hypothetical protein